MNGAAQATDLKRLSHDHFATSGGKTGNSQVNAEHQEMHWRAFSPQDFFHRPFTNEACGASDDTVHIGCPGVFRLAASDVLILAETSALCV